MKTILFSALLLVFTVSNAQSSAKEEQKTKKPLSSILKNEDKDSKKEKKSKKETVSNVKKLSATNVVIAEPEKGIVNPALRIRTKTREFTLGYRTGVTIVTTDDVKHKSNIISLEANSLTLEKENTTISYNNIKTIRILPTRRFIKWATLPTVTYPVMWTCLRKGLHVNTSKCKKNIQEYKLVNRYAEFKYGKDNCK